VAASAADWTFTGASSPGAEAPTPALWRRGGKSSETRESFVLRRSHDLRYGEDEKNADGGGASNIRLKPNPLWSVRASLKSGCGFSRRGWGFQREWPQIRCAPANGREFPGCKRSGTRKSSQSMDGVVIDHEWARIHTNEEDSCPGKFVIIRVHSWSSKKRTKTQRKWPGM